MWIPPDLPARLEPPHALRMALALAASLGVAAGPAPTGAPVPELRRPSQAEMVPAGSPSIRAVLPVLGPAPDFRYLDQDLEPVRPADLLGHVWIADFFFASCTTTCPVLSARMAMVQRQLVDPGLRFVSFSVDPGHDTPAVLKQYAARWRPNESRWHLLATTGPSLPSVARGLHASVTPGPTANDPLIHSAEFTLVDAAGFIRGTYSSEDEAQMKALVEDAAALTTPPALTWAAATSGPGLYLELGCNGCHADARLAPPLLGLLGKTVALDDDRTVRVDTAYLRESIVAPSAKVVDGYPASMPSYAGLLTDGQLAVLVEYLAELGRTTPAPTAARHRVIDPVCGMEISAGTETPRANHQGVSYYFCSELCRARFREAHAASVETTKAK